MIQAPRANPTKFFAINLLFLFCKLDHLITVHYFLQCTETVQLINKSEINLLQNIFFASTPEGIFVKSHGAKTFPL